MTTSFELSFAAVDILAAGLGINCRVFPFRLPSVGYYAEDRTRIAHAVREDLLRRGLSSETDLNPNVVRALRLLAEPEAAVAVMGGDQLLARVSAAGRRGVLVGQRAEGLRFTLISPEALVSTAVGLLPPCRPGPGISITTIRRTEPDPGAAREVPVSVRAATAPADLARRAADEILRRPRQGGGFFLASGRDPGGPERKAPTLGWIDTDAGRYLTVASTDEHGDIRTTFSPADEGRLMRKLTELLDSVRPELSRPWSASGPGQGIHR